METQTVTRLLNRWSRGEIQALTELMPRVLNDLMILAGSRLKGRGRDLTLEAEDLVNETFLKLADSRPSPWRNRVQFFAYVSTTMRRILINHVRNREAGKRGDGALRVTLEDAFFSSKTRASMPVEPWASPLGSSFDEDVFALRQALEGLRRLDSRQCLILELHYFGGLEISEIAASLEISPRTIKRELRSGRIWLLRALGSSETP